jgi:hypothetical protein
MRRLLFIIIALVAFTGAAYAQKPDTVKTKDRAGEKIRKRDSITARPAITDKITSKNKKKYNPDSTHSPSLAFKRSGFIPGWGQIYNGRWWKVPIIYGGLSLLGIAVEFNIRYERQFLRAYNIRRDPTLNTPNETELVKQLLANSGYTEAVLANAVSGYQRNMQLSILGILGVWGIQMIDAYIDAKFIHSYTMDRDLSFKVTPGILNNGPVYAGNFASMVPVIKVTFTLR